MKGPSEGVFRVIGILLRRLPVLRGPRFRRIQSELLEQRNGVPISIRRTLELIIRKNDTEVFVGVEFLFQPPCRLLATRGLIQDEESLFKP